MDLLEEEWIERAKTGDQTALKRVLQEVEAPLYRTALYLLGNEHDALDATQEALLRIYKRLATFKGNSRFETWAQRIVTNVCIDLLRMNKRAYYIKENIELIDPKAEARIQFSGFSSDLRGAIEKLSSLQRAVVIFRYVHDFTYAEIAEVLDLPLNTVKSHLFRARKQLRKYLSEYKESGVMR